MDKEPTSFSEAAYRLCTTKKYGNHLVILGIIFTIIFAIWQSFPNETRLEVIEHLKTKFKDKTSNSYWSSLSGEWQIVFRKELRFKSNEPDNLGQLYSITLLDISDTNIQDLKPLENGKFLNLTHIFGGEKLLSIEGISKVPKLYFLDIHDSSVQSISELESMNSLKVLNLENSKVPIEFIDDFIKARPDVEVKY